MPIRRRSSFVLVVSLALGMGWAPAAGAFEDPGAANPDERVYAPVFADVADDHTFERPIRAVLAAGVTLGCDDGGTRYCPDRPVTRGQMAAFLTRALDLPAPEEPTDFTDDNHSAFENAIERLAAAGITLGCNPPDNNHFCPDRPVTRSQMAAFLTRSVPLQSPPSIPAGVEFSRNPVPGGQRGSSLAACRASEFSLMVRSVTADTDGLGMWEPSSVEASAGEFDLASDRWFLPVASGCESLDVVWDPREVDLSRPLPALRITSPFGPRAHPIMGGTRNHTGTDFDGQTGDRVYASAPGVVIGAGSRGGYGRMVEIRHAGGLDTRYAHLSSTSVSVGDVVGTGDVVGRVGCTGMCTGSHLHFETLHFGVAVDPMSHLDS